MVLRVSQESAQGLVQPTHAPHGRQMITSFFQLIKIHHRRLMEYSPFQMTFSRFLLIQ